MIDMTPLDVRNKRGDFKRIMRGYDPQEVDIFLELVAERLEALVRETIQLRERTQTLQGQVDAQTGREQAVQDALVTAQELRAEMQNQAQREAEHLVKEAQVEARQILAAADTEARGRLRGIERRLDQGQHVLDDLERRRSRFLKEFRSLLEREMDVVSVEEGRAPLEDRAIDLDLGVFREPGSTGDTASSEAASGDSSDLDSAVGEEGADPAPPSTLEMELMAGAEHAGSQAAAQADAASTGDVPDLETVLAESEVEEVRPPSDDEIAPPPAQATPRQDPLTFDANEDDAKR